MSSPRSFNSASPFSSTVYEYLEKGWSPLPLPPKRKEHPPVGYTGRAGRFATRDDIADWLLPYKKGNIAVRLGNSIDIEGVLHEVIGIDVDDYGDKKGGENLKELEKKHGKLPDTWISSSRTDGVSGIRYFLVPYGYGFKGQAAKCIDIIQRVHRYAVVYPSWHPETKAQYRWYAPGFKPSERIPAVLELAFLPDDWLIELTNGKTLDGDGQYGIDLDSTPEELKAWRASVFNDGPPCEYIVRQVKNWIKRIEESPSNHDVITRAHWHLMLSGAEGHTGVEAAIQKINSVWLADIESKQKRSISSAKREVVRSYWGSLRKLKAMADGFAEGNLALFSSEVCMTDWRKPPVHHPEIEEHWIKRIPLVDKGINPLNYDKNDRGVARMFYDRITDNVHWLSDYKAWLLWDEMIWHIDDSELIRDLFDRAVVQPCKRAAIKADANLKKHISTGGTKTDRIGKPLNDLSARCWWIAIQYGNDSKVQAMLRSLKGLPGVDKKYIELNCDSTILAMPGGKCLKLDEPGKPRPNAKGFKVIDNKKQFFATMMTSGEYMPLNEISVEEKGLWNDYLDLFLPDLEYRKFVQKVLGHMLFGGNPSKKAIFLVGITHTGKSTLIHCVRGTLASYGATFSPSAVFKDSGTGNNPELGNLLYKRGIFTSEAGSQRVYANPLKRNSGGDEISVTRKYSNAQIQGVPHFTMIIGTNNVPTIEDADEATMKRILACPFDIQISDENDDPNADQELPKKVRNVVLNWLVDGYVMYIREGLARKDWHPWAVAKTQEFTAQFNDTATFLNDAVFVAPSDVKALFDKEPTTETDKIRNSWSQVTSARLYQAYIDEQGEGVKPISPKAFNKKVRDLLGVDTFRGRAGTDQSTLRWFGLRWKEPVMIQIQG